MDNCKKELIIAMYKAGTFKTGTFYNKCGAKINQYLDLAIVNSVPSLLNGLCTSSIEICEINGVNYQSICAVPLSAITFGYLMASIAKKSFLLRFKEMRCHAEEPRIEGNTEKHHCLVVEEVISSGNSVLEVIKDIEDVGVLVEDVFAIIDLEQGAEQSLKKLGYKLHSLLKMSEITKYLYEVGLVCPEKNGICDGFNVQFVLNGECINETNLEKRRLSSYEERMELCKSKMAKKLFNIIIGKNSNFCLDFITQDFNVLLQVAELIGTHICILIVHLDFFDNLKDDQIQELQRISREYNFLLMDNRKLSEDSDVVEEQCRKILKVVDLLSIQIISNENILTRVKSIIDENTEKGIFVVSSPIIVDTLIKSSYEKSCIDLTVELFDQAVGFISHKNSEIPLNYMHMAQDMKSTGSVSKNVERDYYSPEFIISEFRADIVKLDYSDFSTVKEFAKQKQVLLWNAYLRQIEGINTSGTI